MVLKLIFTFGYFVLVLSDPEGWVVNNSVLYYFSTETTNSIRAITICMAMRANLLSIDDDQEQSFINSHISTGYLMGLITNVPTNGNRGIWHWTDGTPYNVSVWHNWEDGKPEFNDSRCSRLVHTGQWRDENCEYISYRYICKKQDPCMDARNPCVNGICNAVHNSSSYQCHCYLDYAGRNCESNINQCDSNPCVNGQCVDRNNSFTCDCNETGYNGDICQTDINECHTGVLRCLNGGLCINSIGSALCHCSNGTAGENCETDIDECESQPCIHGNCIDELDRYRCDCESGFEGIHCENDIDECASKLLKSTCVHGECTNLNGTYVCKCDDGHYGDICDTNIKDGSSIIIGLGVGFALTCTLLISSVFAILYLRMRLARNTNAQQNE